MQGVRHARCREFGGGTTGPVPGVISFPGIQQVLNVWGGSTSPMAPDGTQRNPFLTITAALAAAAALVPGAGNRIMILVWPGTYVESLTAVAYVDIVGVDRDACVVEDDGAPTLTDAVGQTTYRTMTFRSTSARSVLYVTAPYRVEFFDCVLDKAGEPLIDDENCRVHLNGATDCRFWTCSFIAAAGASWSAIYLEGASVCLIHGCTFLSTYVTVLDTSSLTIESSSFDSTYSQHLINWGSTGAFDCRASNLSQSQRSVIYLSANPSTFTLLDNVMTCAAQYYCVDADAARTGLRIEQNEMFMGGMHSRISHLNPNKFVGASGMKDWYGTTQEALTACTYDDCVVHLLRDETPGAFLVNPANRILTIDGHGKHRLTAPGGSTLAVFNSGSVTLRDLELVGRVYLSGGTISVVAIERCIMDGAFDLFSTPAGSVARVTDSTIISNATHTRALIIGDADPQVVCKRSRLKGYTGWPAIYWGIVNNNLDLKECTVMHGTPIVGNNPFGQSGGLGPITYDAHQCAFNDDPDTVAGSIWTNNVPAGQRFHTIDPGADY